MEAAIYKTTIFKITAPLELEYKYIGEIPIFLGWQILNNKDKEGNLKEIAFNYLPKLKNKNVNFEKIFSKVTIKDLKMHYTEAHLVHLLEEKGIGRPSTFSSLIDKIQERNYVKKSNIEGKSIICKNFELEKNNIIITEEEKIFGNEKNKLIIEPIGIIVIEFLIKHLNLLFKYEYTEILEQKLDLIAKDELNWINICKDFNKEILELIKSFAKDIKKEEYQLDNNNFYIIGKYGPIIKCIEDDIISFKNIKKDIDHNAIKRGEYKLEDIVDNTVNKGRLLGTVDKKDIYLKSGKYGLYIEYGDSNISLKDIKKKENEIMLNDIKSYLESNIIRKIDNNLSIKKGNYGDYIFYKTSNMKKPQFYKLNNFEYDYKTCSIEYIKDWIKEKYNIKS
jgi:DNA topoisomerase-1